MVKLGSHLIRPFAALRPRPEVASEVIAPPYDVLSSEEARARVEGRPWSFLHVSKAEIDVAPGTDPHSSAVYSKAAENFERMRNDKILVRDPEPNYYVYRISVGEHTQTGLVAAASLADYATNRIRKHELTRPDKEDDRVNHMLALNAQTGPVMAVYPDTLEIDQILATVTAIPPETDAVAPDGARHSLWVISDKTQQARLTELFDRMSALYIADGHHRSAAASRVATALRNGNHGGDEVASYEYFLAVIFPEHEVEILDYNRVVTDLAGMSEDQFLSRIGESFAIEPSTGPVTPKERAEFGMYLPGRWFRLTLLEDLASGGDAISRLDVSLLSRHLLAPVLGIEDQVKDHRIDFVGGARGTAELERRVNSGKMAAAFVLSPTRMEDLTAVADSGNVMPPKSTWFEPKLADGLVSHVLD